MTAAVTSEPAAEPMNTPCVQSFASFTSGIVDGRRPPKRIASIGTPVGFLLNLPLKPSLSRTGQLTAGAVKRLFLWAATYLDSLISFFVMPGFGPMRYGSSAQT